MNRPHPSVFNHFDLPIYKAVDGQVISLKRVPYGILIADNKMLITYSNLGFSEMTGFSSSEIIGQTCSFVQGESTNKQTRSEIRVACKNGTTFH
ncbi:MAG: hypothetical protein RL692_1007, partial [Planctomycetota bacterium]